MSCQLRLDKNNNLYKPTTQKMNGKLYMEKCEKNIKKQNKKNKTMPLKHKNKTKHLNIITTRRIKIYNRSREQIINNVINQTKTINKQEKLYKFIIRLTKLFNHLSVERIYELAVGNLPL